MVRSLRSTNSWKFADDVGSRWRRDLSSPRDDYFVNFFAASPKNELTLVPICRESRTSLELIARCSYVKMRVSVSWSQSACINVCTTDRSDRGEHFAHACIIRLGALSSEDDDVIYRNRPRRDCSVRRWMNALSHCVSRREIAVDIFFNVTLIYLPVKSKLLEEKEREGESVSY